MTISMQVAMCRFVDKLKEIYSLSSPIDIENFVKNSLKGSIDEINSLPIEISGRVIKRGESFCIQIRKEESSERKRFTIAHELGHLFFDMGYLTDSKKWSNLADGSSYDRSMYINDSESIANSFAAELLMPKDEYLKQFHANIKESMVNMEPIAKHFKVSIDAAITRGKWLGLISW